MTIVDPKIDPSWKKILQNEFHSQYFLTIKELLLKEKEQFTVFPPGPLIFNAFNLTPFDKVKVVIIGQDPYHGDNQAHGLSFSVPHGVQIPPSLKNIYQELKDDLNITPPSHGNLTNWANEGVLLLNSSLTVRRKQPNSHQKIGWQKFTDAAINQISLNRENIVFMLWGKFAKDKSTLIDNKRHKILLASHPSPFSAYTGFFGCKHFSLANCYLEKNSIAPVNWNTLNE